MSLKIRRHPLTHLPTAAQVRSWRLHRRVPVWVIAVFLPLLVMVISAWLSLSRPDSAPLALDQLTPLSLNNIQRLLVVAPHPDDETLGAGGVIQAALAEGSQVRVVIVTNGDGQRLSPLIIQKTLKINTKEYIQMGERRQQESLAAMDVLGLPAEDVIFLSYPDRGMLPLWNGNWKKNCPWRSSYTGSTHSPYPLTFNDTATYCRQSVMNDLASILEDFQPDLIIVPHPADKHPDHRASNYFAIQAAALLHARQPGFQPEIWGYLMHYADFPAKSSENITHLLLPPAALSGSGTYWGSFLLSLTQARYKFTALHAYASQQVLLGRFLNSFSDTDEIFAILPLPAPAPTTP